MKFLFCFLIVLHVTYSYAAPSTTVGETKAGTKKSHDELIVAVGNQLEHIVSGAFGSKPITLGNYNASMPVALTYDPVSRKLFFSDRYQRHTNILSVPLDQAGDSPAVTSVINKGNTEVIEGLAFDPVDQSLLWTDESKLSIQQASLDPDKSSTNSTNASELVHFLRGDKPRALIADPCNRMMYWINWNLRHPRIESSLMNGSERQAIIEVDLRTPRGLTLDIRKQKIYWANNLHFSTFRIERSNVDGSERELVHSGKGQFVFSLAVSDSYIYWTDWEQHTLWALEKDVSGAQPQIIRHFDHKPMSVILFGKQPLDCAALLNEPTSDETTVSDHITPVYKSEVSLCAGYCFNDGECVEEGNELECRCTDGYTGDRCQDLINVSIPVPTCMSTGVTSYFRFEEQPLLSALIGVSIFCLALLFSVIGLSIRVHRLSQRPRLKRRRFMGTAKRKSGDASADGPVIDIENCCNMNICETPCVEPPSRTPTAERCSGGGGGKSRGKERSSDKQKLLDCDY